MRSIVIPIGIILTAVAAAIGFSMLRTAPPRGETAPAAPLVETVTVSPGAHAVEIRGLGTVEASETHRIIPQVGGAVKTQAPDLQAGSRIQKGAMIFSIDASEYRFRVEQERGNVARAELALKEEEGRRIVAKREWKLLDDTIKQRGVTKELALRQAHLKEKQAALQATKHSLKLAELNVARTRITAPCDGMILSETIAVGQVVSVGKEVARFACTGRLRIIVSIPQEQVRWLLPLDDVARTASVRVNGRQAALVRLLPDVDAASRMARLLLEVDASTTQEPPLLIGSFAEAVIQAKRLEHIYRLPNRGLRENDVIWQVDAENRLRFIPVTVVARQASFSLIRLPEAAAGQDTLRVITTTLPSPYDGMAVTVSGQAAP